jgi:hypothetical protein
LWNPEPYNRVRRRPATDPYHIRAQTNPIQISTLFFTRINSVKLVVIKTLVFRDMTASSLGYRYQHQGVASLLPPSSGYPTLHTSYTWLNHFTFSKQNLSTWISQLQYGFLVIFDCMFQIKSVSDSCICWHEHYKQYNKSNVMHFAFNLFRIKDLYMFRALLAHPQEGIHWNRATANWHNTHARHQMPFVNPILRMSKQCSKHVEVLDSH